MKTFIILCFIFSLVAVSMAYLDIKCVKYDEASNPFCADTFAKYNLYVSSQAYPIDKQKEYDGRAEEKYDIMHNITAASPQCKTALKDMMCLFYTNYCQGNRYIIRPCRSVCIVANTTCAPEVFDSYSPDRVVSYCAFEDDSHCFDGEKVIGNSSSSIVGLSLFVTMVFVMTTVVALMF